MAMVTITSFLIVTNIILGIVYFIFKIDRFLGDWFENTTLGELYEECKDVEDFPDAVLYLLTILASSGIILLLSLIFSGLWIITYPITLLAFVIYKIKNRNKNNNENN